MDTISIAPTIFALVIFLLSVAATIAAATISQRVLAERANQPVGSNRQVDVDARFAQKAKGQTDAREDEDLPKAA